MVTKSLCQCDIDPKGEDACAKNCMLTGKAFTSAIISALLEEISLSGMPVNMDVPLFPCYAFTEVTACKMHTFSCSMCGPSQYSIVVF